MFTNSVSRRFSEHSDKENKMTYEELLTAIDSDNEQERNEAELEILGRWFYYEND